MRNGLLLKTLAVFTCFFVLGIQSTWATNPTPEAANLANTNKPGLLENRGQLVDTDGKPRPDLLFTAESKGVRVYITANGLYYQFQKTETALRTTPSPLSAGLPQNFGGDERTVNSERPHLPHFMGEYAKREGVAQGEYGEVGRGTTTLYRLDVSLVGANPNPTVRRAEATGYYENYYLAHCPDGITGVKSYGRVVLENVYPNIDWVLYRAGEYLKYDFIVRPGGNPDLIKLKFDGAADLKLNADGSFTATTPLGSITEQAPISFQGEAKTQVDSRFVLNGNVLGFEAKGRNVNETLTIDPSLVWATYYGGSGENGGYKISIDASGFVYLGGYSTSYTAIATNGAHQISIGGGANGPGAYNDAFLAKFNSSGVRIWSTYYGGGNYEVGRGVAVDSSGFVYLAGESSSTNAIATTGAHQAIFGGGVRDAFLVKFNSSGVRQWGTYYGGSGGEIGYWIAVDPSGFVYLAGYAESIDGSISTVGAHQATLGGGNRDAFLAKFNSSGVRQWATYYGGIGEDSGTGIAVDPSGFVYFVGATGSSDAIGTAGAHQATFGGQSDAFLVKFNSLGVRQWATYYGGTGPDGGSGVVCDAGGYVYLTGDARSTDSIATAGAHQVTFGGGAFDAFLAKFSSSGVRQWGTYYGGSIQDFAGGVAVDPNGYVYLAGSTGSTTSIASIGAHQDTFGGGANDAFLVKFNSSGSRQWATYYGGSQYDINDGIALDTSGFVYLSGTTQSSNAIATTGAYQATSGGGTYDAYLAKFDGSQGTTAIEPQLKDAGTTLTAYPNPTPNNLTVRFTLPQYGNASVSLLDIQGRSVLAQILGAYPTGEHTYEMDLEHLPAGLYLLKLNAAGTSQTVRVVKE